MPRKQKPKPKGPAMLQAIQGDTPLAALFNEFMDSLAHAEAHTCARYPSYARRYLQAATSQLHAFYNSTVKALAGFEAKQPAQKLARYFTPLAGHLENSQVLFAYSCLKERITSASKLAELNNLSPARRHKLVIATPASALCARLQAALAVGRKAENEYFFLGSLHGLAPEGLAALLRALLALDFTAASNINPPLFFANCSTK